MRKSNGKIDTCKMYIFNYIPTHETEQLNNSTQGTN